MCELNKELFGSFVAAQRKKHGMTQKDLAEKLFVSDKTVSKWERGGSIPDVSLLIPLAKALGVTVAELLNAKEDHKAADENHLLLESLLKKALFLSKETPQERKKRKRHAAVTFCICALFAVAETAVFHIIGCSLWTAPPVFVLFFLLSALFGVFAWLLYDDRLPDFYSEYDARSIALFPRVNHITTRQNWPHMIRAFRIWSVGTMLAIPALCAALSCVPGLAGLEAIQVAFFFIYFGTLFVPVLIAAER